MCSGIDLSTGYTQLVFSTRIQAGAVFMRMLELGDNVPAQTIDLAAPSSTASIGFQGWVRILA